MYAKCFKRVIDFSLALIALVLLLPFLLLLTVVGAIAMKGNPFFTQLRPGKDEKIFRLIKFRTMSNAKDKEGKLLPDAVRLNKYGRFLRSTSLDELPELINIVKGDMAIVGPRPQLVRDMVFMSDKQRERHGVRPGLTGLAQVNGRNNITWEQKFEYDLLYINNGICILEDIKILFQTIRTVLKRSDIEREGTVSDLDYGDWLIELGKIDLDFYVKKQEEAKEIMKQ